LDLVTSSCKHDSTSPLYPDDGGIVFLRNTDTTLPDCSMLSRHRRPGSDIFFVF